MVKIVGPEAKRLGHDTHAYLPELADQLQKGRIGRRDFLRQAALLGMSAGAAYALAGELTGRGFVAGARAQGTPKPGGNLRIGMAVQEMTDPATFNWTEPSNVSRFMVEYLTRTGTDNITRPYLAESWSASEDLKTWTFNIRRGITWSNGDTFDARDVVASINRWLDPATGSSNLGLFDAMVEQVDTGQKDDSGNPVMVKRGIEGAVELVDDYTVRLNLKSPSLSMPENFYNYPTAITHRGFGVDFEADLSKNPIGTGAFTLDEFAVGGKAVLRKEREWWAGDFYLDQITYLDLGNDSGAGLAAMASGQVDMLYQAGIDQIDVMSRLPGIEVYEAVTAQTGVMRFQVTHKPFDNPKVRAAILACMDHAKILEIAYRGRGEVGENHHVAPIHPEYFKLPPLKQDHEKAKALLAEAGYPDGLEVSIDVGDTNGPWETNACQAFREQCAPAGITLNINKMPSNQYWEIWDKTPFGLTTWTHRPLGTMVLSLGYRSGVPWNETKFSSPEFDAALTDAEATLDVNERTAKMEKVETILQDANVIGQPLWRSIFKPVSSKVKNFTVHPTYYHQLHNVWLEDA